MEFRSLNTQPITQGVKGNEKLLAQLELNAEKEIFLAHRFMIQADGTKVPVKYGKSINGRLYRSASMNESLDFYGGDHTTELLGVEEIGGKKFLKTKDKIYEIIEAPIGTTVRSKEAEHLPKQHAVYKPSFSKEIQQKYENKKRMIERLVEITKSQAFTSETLEDLVDEFTALTRNKNLTPEVEEKIEELKQKMLSTCVQVKTLPELTIALRELGHGEEEVKKIIAHANAQANKAEALQNSGEKIKVNGYNILLAKDNGKIVSDYVIGDFEFDKIDNDERRRKNVFEIISAPKEYGVPLDEYDQKILDDLGHKTSPTVQKESIEEKIEVSHKDVLEMLKKGVDRIVVHGGKIKNKENEFQNIIQPDLDVHGALYFLNLIKDKSGNPTLVTYNDGSFTESVPKGQKAIEDAKPGEVIVHIDTGGEEFSAKKINGIMHIFIDHHSTEKKRPTSATQIMSEILSESQEFKKMLDEKPWLKKFVRFVTNFDNLSYVDEKNAEGKNKFTPSSFANAWPKSLYALAQHLPFEDLVKAFEENRDPWKPYNEAEMTKIISRMGKKGDELQKIIEENRKTAIFTVDAVRRAEEANKTINIEESTPELGKIIYHNFPTVQSHDGKSFVNKIPNAYGFMATKAIGRDTYVVFNKEKKEFFLNSTTKDLTEVFERLQKRFPSATLVRGTMIFPPKNEAEWGDFSEEEFLELIGVENGSSIESKKKANIAGFESFVTERGSVYTVLKNGQVQRFKTALLDKAYNDDDKHESPERPPSDIVLFYKRNVVSAGWFDLGAIDAKTDKNVAQLITVGVYTQQENGDFKLVKNNLDLKEPFIFVRVKKEDNFKLKGTLTYSELKAFSERTQDSKNKGLGVIYQSERGEITNIPKVGFNTFDYRYAPDGQIESMHGGNMVTSVKEKELVDNKKVDELKNEKNEDQEKNLPEIRPNVPLDQFLYDWETNYYKDNQLHYQSPKNSPNAQFSSRGWKLHVQFPKGLERAYAAKLNTYGQYFKVDGKTGTWFNGVTDSGATIYVGSRENLEKTINLLNEKLPGMTSKNNLTTTVFGKKVYAGSGSDEPIGVGMAARFDVQKSQFKDKYSEHGFATYLEFRGLPVLQKDVVHVRELEGVIEGDKHSQDEKQHAYAELKNIFEQTEQEVLKDFGEEFVYGKKTKNLR